MECHELDQPVGVEVTCRPVLVVGAREVEGHDGQRGARLEPDGASDLAGQGAAVQHGPRDVGPAATLDVLGGAMAQQVQACDAGPRHQGLLVMRTERPLALDHPDRAEHLAPRTHGDTHPCPHTRVGVAAARRGRCSRGGSTDG